MRLDVNAANGDGRLEPPSLRSVRTAKAGNGIRLNQMPKESLVLNMDDMDTKRKLMSAVGKMSGLWEVWLKPRKLTRTLNQNSYYWAAVVTPFAEWLREEWGDKGIEVEQVHELLKERMLGKVEKDGVSLPPSTRNLTTEEFADYIEKCAAWLAEFAGIVVVPSEMFIEKKK